MEFLAGKKVVKHTNLAISKCTVPTIIILGQVLHGDLATRNVLLALDKTAKISDFGLSRLLLDSKNYTKKSRVKTG